MQLLSREPASMLEEMEEKFMKYRKKPVVIEAVVWDETKETLNTLIAMGMVACDYNSHVFENYVHNLRIRTLEGVHEATKGDYIIRGVEGEFYPCKPDIFEMTYEKAESQRPCWRKGK